MLNAWPEDSDSDAGPGPTMLASGARVFSLYNASFAFAAGPRELPPVANLNNLASAAPGLPGQVTGTAAAAVVTD